MARIEITETEFNEIHQLQRDTEAKRRGGHYAQALHVYISDDGRGVIDQHYAHSSWGIPTIEAARTIGKFYKYIND